MSSSKDTRKILLNFAVFGGLLALLLAGFLFWVRPMINSENIRLARGQALYEEYCAVCHGNNLEGQANWQDQNPDGTYPAPPQDETGHTFHHPDRLLIQYITEGGAAVIAAQDIKGVTSAMPAFGDRLSATDIEEILAYIKSTWPKELRELQRKTTAEDIAARG